MATAVYGTVSEKHIADTFLAGIGASATPEMERAVIAWMRFESGRGVVTANNPWNLTGSLWKDIVGYWRGGSATEQHDFPIFANIDSGTLAAAQNLSTNAYGYPAAVAAARRNDAPEFLQALAASQWCTCHYPSWVTRSGAQAAINSITPGNVTTIAPGHSIPSTATAILASTDADLQKAMQQLLSKIPGSTQVTGATGLLGKNDAWRIAIPDNFAGCPNGTTAVIGPTVGNPDGTHVCFITDAGIIFGGAADKFVGGVGDTAAFLGKLADPQNWGKILAIIGGSGMIVAGGIIIYRSG